MDMEPFVGCRSLDGEEPGYVRHNEAKRWYMELVAPLDNTVDNGRDGGQQNWLQIGNQMSEWRALRWIC